MYYVSIREFASLVVHAIHPPVFYTAEFTFSPFFLLFILVLMGGFCARLYIRSQLKPEELDGVAFVVIFRGGFLR